jgi:hypothetical protein
MTVEICDKHGRLIRKTSTTKLPSHFNCLWKVTPSRNSSTVSILESARRREGTCCVCCQLLSTPYNSFPAKIFLLTSRKSHSTPSRNSEDAWKRTLANVAQAVLKDSHHETIMFLSTFKVQFKLWQNTSKCIINSFKTVSFQYLLLFRLNPYMQFLICPMCTTSFMHLFFPI